MASATIKSPEIESSRGFQRSLSRVFYESDCSTPTSWEFRILKAGRGGRSPISSSLHHHLFHHQQIIRESPLPQPLTISFPGSTTTSPANEIRPDGSRNSTGSSTGSHKSQDSGFSDSGETRGSRRKIQNSFSPKSNHEYTSNETQILAGNRSSLILCPKYLFIDDQSPSVLSPTHHNYHHQRFNSTPASYSSGNPPPLPSTLPPSMDLKTCNGTIILQTPISAQIHTMEPIDNNDQCSCCSFQEVILSGSTQGVISPFSVPEEGVGGEIRLDIGTPACCSTPKQITGKNLIQLNALEKIDNFETLNKNLKSMDSNSNHVYHTRSNSSSSNQKQHNSNFNETLPTSPASNSFLSSNSYQRTERRKSGSNSGINSRQNSLIQIKTPEKQRDPREFCESPLLINELSSHSSRGKVFVNSPKWQSLPKGYKRVPHPENSSEHLIVKSHFDNDAMRHWLHELRSQTQSECLNSLQVKSIRPPKPPKTDSFESSTTSTSSIIPSISILAVSVPLLSIRNIERMANLISEEFSRICKHLEFGLFHKVSSLVLNLVGYIEGFLRHFQDSFGNLFALENRLSTSCTDLRFVLKSFNNLATLYASSENKNHMMNGLIETPDEHAALGSVVEGIVNLGNLFSQVVDQRLSRDLSSLLDTIENGGISGQVALSAFAAVLADGGMHICRLSSEIRTVRVLLGSLLDAKDDHVRLLSLRCLATQLCVGEAVKDFDKAGGFEIVSDLLYDPNYIDYIKFEAVAVITQATDPWIDLETTLGSLSFHLEKIIISLTNLISQCSMDEDSFLLTVAAISNLTFLELTSIDTLRRCNTIYYLIESLERKNDFSIFILDHIATILANMAGVEKCRKEIVERGAIKTLVNLLRKSPSFSQTAPEIAACERVQQKSTIAISRLCNEEGVAQLVLEMNGIDRLIELSKEEKERNYSDGVLIACLATLRKLVIICGDEIIKRLGAEDLIKPRLLDSFLLFSSRQESYV